MEEQTSFSPRSQQGGFRRNCLALQALHSAGNDEVLRVLCNTCPGHGSVCLDDGGIEAYYQASLKSAADPDGGPFPAYPSGKSWDETSGKTGSGKKFRHNAISGADFAAQPMVIVVLHRRSACWSFSLKIREAGKAQLRSESNTQGDRSR